MEGSQGAVRGGVALADVWLGVNVLNARYRFVNGRITPILCSECHQLATA
jgi:hypothetical protein